MSKEGLLSLGLIVLFVLSIFCGHFSIGITDDLTDELPSTGWEAITDSLNWLVACLTFQLTTPLVVLSSVIWIFIVVTIFIPIILIIRGN